MPTFKIQKRVGSIKNNNNEYTFTDKNNEKRKFNSIEKKIVIDKYNILIYNASVWTKITVNNIKEDESWNGWDDMFSLAKSTGSVLKGHNDKNETFLAAIFDSKLII